MKTKYILLFLFLTTIYGCKKDNNPAGPGDDSNNDKIEIGPMIDLRTETIGTAGGTIRISGSNLDGMEIVIPPNSFPDSKTFTISSAEVKSHQLGEYVNPISPLIKISCEGGYADEVINVKVPVKVPKGYFAMGFFYDEVTGTLEGLPLLASDSVSVTLCTRHFSTSTLSGSSANSFLKRKDLTSYSNMIISSIKESVLFGRPVISTGYNLKEDDWEFANYGSYIAPGGHCAGQSMTSMWYYYEKNLRGAPNLYGLYDENEKIWPDNPKGYRFASTVQEDISFGGILFRSLLIWEASPSYHYLSWSAFAYTMLLGEPQFVGVSNSTSGHAIVAYKMSITDGTLYVADPNFPGEIRTITFQNGRFQPYSSKQNANQIDNTSFTGIGYYSKTSMIEWDKIRIRWNEFENGTIGADRFPGYQLWMLNGRELKDSIYTDEEFIEVHCKSTECMQCLPMTDHLQLIDIYDDKGNSIDKGDSASLGVAYIKLKLGLNKFGVHIMGARENIGDHYIDFKWINVYRDTLTIEPGNLNGQPGQEYTFTARTFGTGPKTYKMVWNFGDNSPEVTVHNDSTAKHAFTSSKFYYINVNMYDQANDIIGSADAFANISASLVNIISSALNGEPILVPGVTAKEYTFTAKNNGLAPKNGKAKFVWDFGDGSPAETIMNDSLVTHIFTRPGNFTISVKIYDDAKLIGEASSRVDIKSRFHIEIQSASADGAPIIAAGKVNTEYTFVGRTNGTAPNSYKMEWDFGDNTPAVAVNNDSTAKHTYTSAGDFSITVQLYNAANELLAQDSATASINAQYFYINNIVPDYGLWGDTVYISGSGFGNAQGLNTVVFKTERTASAILWSDTLIKVIVPDGSENGGVLVSIGGLSKTTSYFTSAGSLIDSIKSKSSFYSFFAGMLNFSNGLSQSNTIGNSYDYPFNGIVWQENTFKVEIHDTAGTSTQSYKITVTLDDRGTLLKSLKWEHILIYYSDYDLKEIRNRWENGFTITNVPWNRYHHAEAKYTMDLSKGISSHITEVHYSYESTEFPNSSYNLTSVDWTWEYTIFELYIFNPL